MLPRFRGVDVHCHRGTVVCGKAASMTTATASPHIFSLSPEERCAEYDAASERAMAAALEIAAEHNARKPDPHAGEYLSWRVMGMVCILVVKHRDLSASFEISRDGAGARIYMPKSKVMPLVESDGDFMLALLPRSFVKWIGIKDPSAGARFRELFGVTMPLAADRVWTDAECETWTRLDRRRSTINVKIQTAKHRTKYNAMKRVDAA